MVLVPWKCLSLVPHKVCLVVLAAAFGMVWYGMVCSSLNYLPLMVNCPSRL